MVGQSWSTMSKGSMALSKHVNHYGPLSSFLYFNMTKSGGLPPRPTPTRGCAEQLCELKPWEPSPVPSVC